MRRDARKRPTCAMFSVSLPFYSLFPSDELQDDAPAKKRSRFGCFVSCPVIIPVVFSIVSFSFSSFLSIRSGIRYPHTEIYTGKDGEGTAAKGGFLFQGSRVSSECMIRISFYFTWPFPWSISFPVFPSLHSALVYLVIPFIQQTDIQHIAYTNIIQRSLWVARSRERKRGRWRKICPLNANQSISTNDLSNQPL